MIQNGAALSSISFYLGKAHCPGLRGRPDDLQPMWLIDANSRGHHRAAGDPQDPAPPGEDRPLTAGVRSSFVELAICLPACSREYSVPAACLPISDYNFPYHFHCTSICPLGLAGNILGRINPFRVRIGDTCNECERCLAVCRYNALDFAKIQRRRPGYTCTLCGDCIGACSEKAISYSFPGLNGSWARLAFLILVISLHAVFLGVARI